MTDIRQMMKNSDENKKVYHAALDKFSTSENPDMQKVYSFDARLIGALMNYVTPEDFKMAIESAQRLS